MTLQIQAIIAAGLLICGFGSGWYFSGLRGKAQVSQMQASAFQSLAEAYAKQQTDNALKQKQLEKENAGLVTDALKYPNISVCHYTPAVVPPGGSQGQVVHTGTRLVQENPLGVPPVPRPDPGPFVFGLADAADKLAALCRSL